MLHEDRRRAGSFGEDAEQYDRSRPTYPAALIDHLVAARPKTVLEAGCGTGIASRLFVDRGCEVLGVEADGRMAAVARSYGLVVEEGTFEEWEPAGRHFDLMVSAQAWHWIDAAAGTRKAAQALRPGGRAAVFWNRGEPPEDLRAALYAAYLRTAPDLAMELAGTDAVDEHDEDCEIAAAAFTAHPAFVGVAIRPFHHSVEYTTADWVDQLPTHSDHRTLPPDRLAAVLTEVGEAVDRFGGAFRMDYSTWLVEAVYSPPD